VSNAAAKNAFPGNSFGYISPDRAIQKTFPPFWDGMILWDAICRKT
jgi:hypothetical protein